MHFEEASGLDVGVYFGGADVRVSEEQLHGAQGQGYYARAYRITQILVRTGHIRTHHGLQYIVDTAHRQTKRVLDFGQSQTMPVAHQQVKDIKSS